MSELQTLLIKRSILEIEIVKTKAEYEAVNNYSTKPFYVRALITGSQLRALENELKKTIKDIDGCFGETM